MTSIMSPFTRAQLTGQGAAQKPQPMVVGSRVVNPPKKATMPMGVVMPPSKPLVNNVNPLTGDKRFMAVRNMRRTDHPADSEGGGRDSLTRPPPIPSQPEAPPAQQPFPRIPEGGIPGPTVHPIQPWKANDLKPQPPVQPPVQPPTQPPGGPSVPPTLQPPPQQQSPSGATTTPVTGQEVPQKIMPGQSDQMKRMLEMLEGRLGGGQLGGALNEEAMRQLKQPGAYDDELMQNAIAQGRRSLDRQFTGQREGLSAELGSRGLEYGTHAAGRFGDLAAQQGYAEQDLMNNILRERAASLGSERAAAFGNASGLHNQGINQSLGAAGLFGNMERGMRDEERGERGYVDNLARQGRSDAIEEFELGERVRRGREQDSAGWIQSALGQGPGSGDLWGGVDAYGGKAAGQTDMIAQLAQLLGQGAYGR